MPAKAAKRKLKLKDLMDLQIWRYLGADVQEGLVNRFEKLTNERQSAIVSALLALEESYEEITEKSNEATFAYLVQDVLMDLAFELESDLKVARKEVRMMHEEDHYDTELDEIEKQMAEFGL